MMSLHDTPLEQLRLKRVVDLLPQGRATALDVGAREGWMSMALLQHFQHVTALDLSKPVAEAPRLTTVAGDATDLHFPDNAFDTVICAEVLEHIPSDRLERACNELRRVAKYDVIVGTPYREDNRVGRATCRKCGNVNPPWGHVNIFDRERLLQLFRPLKAVATVLIGSQKSRTNPVSVKLLEFAGNPWGTYGQVCIHCDSLLEPPSGQRTALQRIAAKAATLLNDCQSQCISPAPTWIYMVFEKIQLSKDIPIGGPHL